MSFVVWFAVAMAGVCATGMAAWLWFAVTSVNEELRSFAGFEGMHFEA